jgi:hypothetical protein
LLTVEETSFNVTGNEKMLNENNIIFVKGEIRPAH